MTILSKESKAIIKEMCDHAAQPDFLGKSVYPQHCRFLFQNRVGAVAVIEQKPQARSVRINNHRTSFLSFPYVIFIINFRTGAGMGYNRAKCCGNDPARTYLFSKINVAYRNQALSGWDDVLGKQNLPNGDGLAVCMGIMRKRTWDNLPLAVNDVINHFWSSQWKGNLDPGVSPLIESVAAWERATKLDPTFILNVDWRKGPRLGFLVKNLVPPCRKPEVLTPVAMRRQLESIIAAETTKNLTTIISGVTGETAKKELIHELQKMYKGGTP